MLITLQDIQKCIDEASYVNTNTKRIYKTCLHKIHGDLVFNSKQDLEELVNNLTSSISQAYSLLGLLRTTCTVCDLPNEIKNVVYPLYKEYNKSSKLAQINNRHASKWTVNSLIEFNRTLRFDSYEHMIAKLMIGLYTLIPPLRNDYIDVKINGSGGNCVNLETGELSVYSTKSKKMHSVIIPAELREIITESIQFQPRDYLFVTVKNKPFKNANNMYTRLMKIVKRVLGEDDFTINTFRHLYVMHSNSGTVQERIDAANGMMHSVQTHFYYGQSKSA